MAKKLRPSSSVVSLDRAVSFLLVLVSFNVNKQGQKSGRRSITGRNGIADAYAASPFAKLIALPDVLAHGIASGRLTLDTTGAYVIDPSVVVPPSADAIARRQAAADLRDSVQARVAAAAASLALSQLDKQ